MKRFFCKLIMFTVTISIITLAVNYLFIKMDKSNPNGTNKFDNIPNTLDVCNFGSSHGLFGFNYADIQRNGYTCFNFGLVSQSISYDYRLMQQYGNHIVEGTIVFIPISYFSLFGKDEEDYEDFESKNQRYYLILPPELIKNYDVKANIYAKYLPAIGVDTATLIKVLIGKKLAADNNENNQVIAASDIDVPEDARAAFERHIEKNKLDDNGNRILNQQELDALYDLIEYCQDKGAVPILVTTPYLSEYTDEVKKAAPDFYDEFYSVIDAVIKSSGVDYYDYAFDERFSHSYDLFMNADHLNKEGARQFTNILMEEVVGKYN